MGEFLHAAGTAAAGAVLAQKGAKKIQAGAQKLGHGAQNVVRGFQTLDAINKGAKSYSTQMKEMGSERSAGSLERGYIAGQLLQGAKNKAGSILTGVKERGTDDEHNPTGTVIGVGSGTGFSGANGQMTHADAVKAQTGERGIAAQKAEKDMETERERIAARDNQPNPTSNKGMRNGGANGGGGSGKGGSA
jgi:hypothetical protein